MFTVMKEMYSYEEVGQIPLYELFNFAEFLEPKQQEIANRQQNAMLEAELSGKSRVRNRR